MKKSEFYELMSIAAQFDEGVNAQPYYYEFHDRLYRKVENYIEHLANKYKKPAFDVVTEWPEAYANPIIAEIIANIPTLRT